MSQSRDINPNMIEQSLTHQAALLLEKTSESRDGEKEISARIAREVAHGYDVQRWAKILDPQASDELLAAALLHDVERIVNLEQNKAFGGDRNSPEYKAHKRQHAQRSASYVSEQLSALGIPSEQTIKIALLIAHHDDSGDQVTQINDPDLNTLVAADSFSFFTSVASDMLVREGESRLADKVFFMVEKMPVSLRQLLREQDFTDPSHNIDPELAIIIESVKTTVLLKFT